MNSNSGLSARCYETQRRTHSIDRRRGVLLNYLRDPPDEKQRGAHCSLEQLARAFCSLDLPFMFFPARPSILHERVVQHWRHLVTIGAKVI